MTDKSQKEILIADDNVENLRVLSQILMKNGYKVRVAKNGLEALSSIKAARPSLILLDGHMPEMDGFELCSLLKKDEKYQKIQIIFLSALTDSYNKMHAFKAGADDYITKPFDSEEVIARIQIHLKLHSYVMELEKLKIQLEKKEEEIKKLKGK